MAATRAKEKGERCPRLCFSLRPRMMDAWRVFHNDISPRWLYVFHVVAEKTSSSQSTGRTRNIHDDYLCMYFRVNTRAAVDWMTGKCYCHYIYLFHRTFTVVSWFFFPFSFSVLTWYSVALVLLSPFSTEWNIDDEKKKREREKERSMRLASRSHERQLHK